ncbi:MAG: hypothetical protein QME63_00405 [Actinomycetota bacterium]|nr:hypothetical protein [Actinomycetota bacterium]
MAVTPSGSSELTKPADELISLDEKKIGATKEQLTYSSILGLGRKVGLAGIIAAFVVYITGLITPRIPLERVPQVWNLSSSDYLKAVGLKPGWSWLAMYRYSDMLNFFGIAILGIISIICYLAIIPEFIRKKDKVYVAIAILEVIVLAVAASGIINIGE